MQNSVSRADLIGRKCRTTATVTNYPNEKKEASFQLPEPLQRALISRHGYA